MPSVLIIDDSPTQVAFLREQLRGLRILHRSSASLEQQRPLPTQADLVLVALILSRHNGFECGLKLRELGFANIVLYSDCPEDTDADWASAIGLQGLMQLPVPMRQLRQQIQSRLSDHTQGSEDEKRWAS